MADGRTKPIAKLVVGDRIYGTERRGGNRRYTTTDVLAHWTTMKPAYRVSLEDGTELIASGDHRFLTNRGWKHVTGCEQGFCRRPFLTESNRLIGVGGFPPGPSHDGWYRRGYLCGMIRGDGHVGVYAYPRPGRTSCDLYRFRLALADYEGLERTRGYLELEGIDTDEFEFHAGTATTRPIRAIRSQKRSTVEAIRSLIEWPRAATIEWHKGFLAGIFDAEGSCSGVIRIPNTDTAIIRQIMRSLDELEFGYVVERPRAGMECVRLRGGFRERLAFFHTVDPAITRKRTFERLALKGSTSLKIEGIEPLGIDLPMYDITTGTGDFIANGVVSHNCFARPTHTYLDMNAGKDFETKIVVKVNAPEVLRRQLGAKKWKGEGIAMGTNTDPYQRAEGRYKLTRRIIEALTDYRNPFSILTKGTLILRDLDLLVEAAKVTDVGTAFSIGTLDEDVWRKTEPGTPNPRARMEAVAALNAAGIPCGILMAPVLPGISDRPDQLREVVTAAIDAGATHVSPILLHLRPGVREEFMPWLAETYPDLVPRYEQMYRTPYGPPADRNALGAAVGDLIREHSGMRPAPERPRRWRTSERARGTKPEQLELI
jgi:DNA repair photolyase